MSVPNIIVSHPKSVVFDGYKYHTPREDVWELNAQSEIHVQKVLDFINNRSKRNIELRTPPIQIFVTTVYILTVLSILGAIVY